VNHRQVVTDAVVSNEMNKIDDLLRAFWEKARAASDMIAALRADRHALEERLAGVERELASLRAQINAKEQELRSKDQEAKRLKTERDQLISSNGHDRLSDEEKERLKARIRELIARINSHL